MKATTEKSLIHCLIIALAIFIPYSQVAQHRFIEFDDGLYTFMNTYIIQGLTWDSVVWAFTNNDAANWHPLTWLSHLVDRELFGPHPGGYLLMNVAWHTLAACLCYLAFFKCTKQRFFALTVALIFALHPVNVENVAWTSERKSLIDAFFWFLGIIAYIDYLETRQLKFYGLVVITHLLGLMGKAMHVTFPCTLVLIHLLHATLTSEGQVLSLRDYRQLLFRSLKLVWPLLIISIYFSAITASAQAKAMSNLDMLPIASRLTNVTLAYQKYIMMFFSPGELAPFYPLFFSELQPAKAIVPVLVLGCITLLLVVLFKKRPVPLLGWFWFLGTMVPAVGLVQVGAQSHADRYLYIPMIGLAFMFPELFATVKSWTTQQMTLVRTGWMTLIALSLGAATYIQVGYWQNGVSLFQHSLNVTGDCLTSVNCLTCAYLRNDRLPEAITFLDSKILVAKNPLNKAKFYTLKSKAQLGLQKFEAAIESGHQAIGHGGNEALIYWILANAYYRLDKLDLAREALASAKQLLGIKNQAMLADNQIRDGISLLDELLNKNPSTSEHSGSVNK